MLRCDTALPVCAGHSSKSTRPLPLMGKVVIPFNVNLGSFLAMLGALGGEVDARAPGTGVHHLADFFRQHLTRDEADLRVGR